MSDYEIVVPTAYRLHLTRIKATDMAIRTVVLVGLTAGVVLLHWWLLLILIVPLLLLLVAAYVAWFSTLGRDWNYIVNDRGAHLIGTPLKPLWTWVDLSWSSRLPVEVTEDHWRDLPAVAVSTSHYGRCLLVYGLGDASRIRDEVLPKIRQWTRASNSN